MSNSMFKFSIKILMVLAFLAIVSVSANAQQSCPSGYNPVTSSATVKINGQTSYGFCVSPTTGQVIANGITSGDINSPGDAPNMLAVRSALAKLGVIGGGAQVNIICVGDSICAGAGATASYTAFFTQTGALYQQFYGNSGSGFVSTLGGLTLAGSWGNGTATGPGNLNGGSGTAGSMTMRGTSSATITLAASSYSFQPAFFDIYGYTFTDTGTGYGVTIDGVSQGTFCGTVTVNYTTCKTTVSITNSNISHTLVITAPASGAAAYIMGVASRNVFSGIVPFNISVAGASSDFYGGLDYNTSWISMLTPNAGLAFIELGQNDGGIDPTITVSNINRIFQALRAQGIAIVLIESEPDNNASSCVPNPPTSYCRTQNVAAQLAFASLNGIPVVDIFHRWVNYSAANTLGLYADGVHPSQIGHNDISLAIEQALQIPIPGMVQGNSLATYAAPGTSIPTLSTPQPGYNQGYSGQRYRFHGYQAPGIDICQDNANNCMSITTLFDGSAQIVNTAGFQLNGGGGGVHVVTGLRIDDLKSTTGVIFLCIDSNHLITAQAAACVGTI